jgi:hypothetical protein
MVLQPFNKTSISTGVLSTEWEMNRSFCFVMLASFTHCFEANGAFAVFLCERLDWDLVEVKLKHSGYAFPTTNLH